MAGREVFICVNCGTKSPQWKGQCTSCQEWNSLEAHQEQKSTALRRKTSTGINDYSAKIVSLQDFSLQNEVPYGTGVSDLDHILGKGLVPGAALLFGGEPGIGKSTLLLQIVGAVAGSGRKVLYASGEEGLGQIKARAERLGVLGPNLDAIATGRLDEVLSSLQPGSAPSLLVVDSVQTFSSSLVDGLPGSVSQVRAVATELIEHCRACSTTLFLVGHVTKDGQLAGPKLLEHMVDTVISLEGDRQFSFRILRVIKNRFGPNQELIVFEMCSKGMLIVEDPSTFFLGARNPELSGTSVVMAADGHRPFAIEVQALVSRSFLSIPRRAAVGFDVNRLHLLLAVLEKRLKLNFGSVDIYAKIGGGLKIQEPGMDLGLVVAVLSSFYDIPLPEKGVFWGEVDLNGQIRPVSAHDVRFKQASRLGYNPIFCPTGKESCKCGVDTIMQLQQKLFKK